MSMLRFAGTLSGRTCGPEPAERLFLGVRAPFFLGTLELGTFLAIERLGRIAGQRLDLVALGGHELLGALVVVLGALVTALALLGLGHLARGGVGHRYLC